MGLVITFPDYQGKQAAAFGQKLYAAYPHARIVPFLNGPDHAALSVIASKLRNSLEPVVVKGQGLLQATLDAYELLVAAYPNDTIVKLDTAEHPIKMVGVLAQRAQEIEGLVVGDLTFDNKTLVEGTPDWYVHLHTFPIMYSLATKGLLALSCAHGFQAFAPSICLRALHGAGLILAEVKHRFGEMPRWGLDGAMAISCAQRAIPCERIGVPAQTLRNREASKIDEQTRAHMTICLASAAVFN